MTKPLTFPQLMQWVAESIRDPRGFMRMLKSIEMLRAHQWQLLIVASIIGVFVNHISFVMMFDDRVRPASEVERAMFANALLIIQNPYIHAMLYTSILVIACFALFWVARLCGGTGDFGSGILAIAWISFVTAVLGMVQLAVLNLSAILGDLLGLAIIVITLSMMTRFIAEIHGFVSLFQVFVMMIATTLGFMIGFGMILGILGITIMGPSV